jgi:hypothetical protein
LQFPPVTDECLRHFIRGCWDGDGSVFVNFDKSRTKNQKRIGTSFTCGSREFIKTIADKLKEVGLPKRNITKDRDSFCIRFGDRQCRELYSYLYRDVPPEQYLERKYKIFEEFFGKLQNPNNNVSEVLGVPSKR